MDSNINSPPNTSKKQRFPPFFTRIRSPLRERALWILGRRSNSPDSRFFPAPPCGDKKKRVTEQVSYSGESGTQAHRRKRRLQTLSFCLRDHRPLSRLTPSAPRSTGTLQRSHAGRSFRHNHSLVDNRYDSTQGVPFASTNVHDSQINICGELTKSREFCPIKQKRPLARPAFPGLSASDTQNRAYLFRSFPGGQCPSGKNHRSRGSGGFFVHAPPNF